MPCPQDKESNGRLHHKVSICLCQLVVLLGFAYGLGTSLILLVALYPEEYPFMRRYLDFWPLHPEDEAKYGNETLYENATSHANGTEVADGLEHFKPLVLDADRDMVVNVCRM